MTNKKYILGGGISGLIFAYYNPQYTIISKDIGGLIKDEFMEATILLHNTPFVINFLDSLNIKYKQKIHNIRYLKNYKIIDEISSDDKINFINKKLITNKSNFKDLKLSTSDYYVDILKIDWKELLDKLTKNISYINDDIIRITENKIVCKKSIHMYKNIISTIPASIFWKLYYDKTNNLNIKTEKITIVLSDKLPEKINNEFFDLLYIIDNSYKYTRINKFKDKYLYEFSGEINKKDIIKYLPINSLIINHKIFDGLIYSNENNIPPSNIKFLGRFAQHKHSIKICDVIEESQKNFNFESMYNKQKIFNLNFFDFNVENKNEKNNILKNFIINLVEEISEFSTLTISKDHRSFKEPDRKEVLFEYIDMFKYILGIANVYGFSVDEIYSAFWNKSKIVEDKYRKFKNGQE